jgi:hypothetical protein
MTRTIEDKEARWWNVAAETVERHHEQLAQLKRRLDSFGSLQDGVHKRVTKAEGQILLLQEQFSSIVEDKVDPDDCEPDELTALRRLRDLAYEWATDSTDILSDSCQAFLGALWDCVPDSQSPDEPDLKPECVCNVNFQGAPRPEYKDGCPAHPRQEIALEPDERKTRWSEPSRPSQAVCEGSDCNESPELTPEQWAERCPKVWEMWTDYKKAHMVALRVSPGISATELGLKPEEAWKAYPTDRGWVAACRELAAIAGKPEPGRRNRGDQ